MPIPLSPGTLVTAGFDKPWYAPQSAINSALEKMGFQAIQWHEGQTGAPQSRTVTSAGDWDYWITAVYQGAPTQFEPPEQIKWVLVQQGIPNQAAYAQTAAPEQPLALAMVQNAVQNTTPEQVFGAILMDLGLGMLFMHLVRNRKKGPRNV